MAELKAFHLETFGKPTSSRHRVWLVRHIAWRLQADAEGDLTERALRRAAELSEGRNLRERRPPQRRVVESSATKVVALPPRHGVHLVPGTVLEREWKGEVHRVIVHPEGFEYRGQFYPSISAVALAITGTSWSGYRCYGLKKPAQQHGREDQ